MKKEKFITYFICCIALLQVLLILISWIVTAAIPQLPVHSLLSNEGIRWFFGNFTDNIQSILLVWIILLCIAYGALRESKLLLALKKIFVHHALTFIQRFAIRTVLFEFLLFTLVIIFLTCVPHAILLSATGHLIPSSFSKCIVPIISFCVILFSVTYGSLSGTLSTLPSVIKSLSSGISYCAPIFIIYVLFIELYYSVLYVFSL